MPTIYGANLSPFVRKVRAFMSLKGLDYTLESVMPGSEDPEFRARSPLGKIPAFANDELSISDSSVICTYLERTHPEPALYPEAPVDLARTLWLEEYADTRIAERIGGAIFFPRVVSRKLMGKEIDDDAVQRAIDEGLPPVFDYLESQLTGAPHLVGGVLTIADIAVSTHFINLGYADVRVDEGRWPQLAAYIDYHHANDYFKPFIEEESKLFDR